MEKTEKELLAQRDETYARFFSRLVPMIDSSRIAGVRKPQWIQIWKSLDEQEKKEFLNESAHIFLEEDLIHIYALNFIRDKKEASEALNGFEDHINCWALTDGLTFPYLKDEELLSMAKIRLDDPRSYSRRLAVLWIMKRAIKKDNAREWIEKALDVNGEEKEIIDAKGWLLCEVLIINPKAAQPFFNRNKTERKVLLRAISKCIDSKRISDEKKNELRNLRNEIKRQYI